MVWRFGGKQKAGSCQGMTLLDSRNRSFGDLSATIDAYANSRVHSVEESIALDKRLLTGADRHNNSTTALVAQQPALATNRTQSRLRLFLALSLET